MVGAVRDEQDRPAQVFVQRGQDGQTGGTRQSKAWKLFPVRLELLQQLLILRKRANLIENNFHNLYVLRFYRTVVFIHGHVDAIDDKLQGRIRSTVDDF